MKKTALVLLVLCVVAAFAYTFQPAGYIYKNLPGQGYINDWGPVGGDAQMWLDISSALAESCDKPVWGPYTYTDHASIAQWVSFTVQGRYNYWRIRKPGIFAAMGPEFNITSNGNFTLDWNNLGDLQGTYSTIPKWYWWGWNDDPPAVEGSAAWDNYWTRAVNFNDYPFVPTNSWHAYLWERIDVAGDQHPCEYENVGSFTITLNEQKPWILSDGSITLVAPTQVPE
jgi:hypothetical protein